MIEYNPRTKISPHFTHREVARSQTASRWGIDNTPDSCILERATHLARNVLEPTRTYFGVPFSPSSWYRCEELERKVCFKGYYNWRRKFGYDDTDQRWAQYFRRKQHPTGGAADIEVPGFANDALYHYILENLEFDQLIREFRRPDDPMSGWVHVSFNSLGNRGQHFQIG